MSRDARNLLLIALMAMLGYMLWTRSISEMPWSERRSDYYAAIQAAEPLVDAIKNYSERRKEPPESLDQLLPGYIGSIPETTIQRCGKYKYARFGDGKVYLMWYDLGPLQGRALAKESKYPDGDPNHSLLVFTIGETGQVVDARLDRMPKGIEGLPFNSDAWAAGMQRMEMAVALPDEYRLARMPQEAIEKLLGAPDGIRIMRDTPWELRVNCPKGFLKRDILIYWPSENYPKQLYGGNTLRLENWIFVEQQ